MTLLQNNNAGTLPLSVVQKVWYKLREDIPICQFHGSD
jgi:hypothetical protein